LLNSIEIDRLRVGQCVVRIAINRV
jgi:hypothetical protein